MKQNINKKILPPTIDWGLRDEATKRLDATMLPLKRKRCEFD